MKSALTILSILGITLNSCNHNPSPTISTLPPFHILLPDSSTILQAGELPKGTPLILIYFRPDCPHCNRETDTLMHHMGELNNVRIYFVTSASFQDIHQFSLGHGLLQYKNITIGQDMNHSFNIAFHPSSIPYIAIYDAQQKLVKVLHGEAELSSILNSIKG